MAQNYNPLESLNEIQQDIPFVSFEYKNYFTKLGNISADIDNEKIFINVDEDKEDTDGIVYLLVINDNIIKVGSTITTFAKRLQSYNCGKKQYRKNGTCSTTNYFVLQTFLNFFKEDENVNIEVYTFKAEKIKTSIFGKTKIVSIPPKDYEKQILEYLKEREEFPALCVQT